MVWGEIEPRVKALLILLSSLWLVVVVLLPVGQLLVKSVTNASGQFVGLANFAHYVKTPALADSIPNSLFVSTVTTLIAVPSGFLYAYALTRSCLPAKGAFKGVAMIPLFAPTLLNGIALIYLFGRKGLITRGFFGAIPGFDIHLYGPVGIILSEIIYTFPQAVLILSIALSMTDARLYEASESLKAGRVRTFFTVTLPSVKYGLTSAIFVCFILTFTDFGAPKVVGGNYNILATDIYKQVIGQQNFTMGAVVSVVLLVPTLFAFVLDRVVQKKQVAMVSGRSVPLTPKPEKTKDRLLLGYCLLVGFLIVGFYGTALFASLVKVWPYKLSLGLWHYNFTGTGGGGYTAFFNSIRVALCTAFFGTIITFTSAWLVEKAGEAKAARQATYLLSMLPLALPGLVIGLSYIFFFNAKGWTLFGTFIPNPFEGIYGTMAIVVICNIVHFYTVSFLTATTALKQLDSAFETVADSMGVPFYKTFMKVTVPICLPAIMEIALYYFVNAMVTVSAVIFLYSADLPLASVAIANMDDAGDIAPACAMAMLVVFTNIVCRLLYEVVHKMVQKKRELTAKI